MASQNIFISAASSEFGKLRDDLHDGLRSPYRDPTFANYDTSPEDQTASPVLPLTPNVIAQGKPTFKAAGGNTIQLLAQLVDACEVVIHLIGNSSGTAVSRLGVDIFRDSNLTFSRKRSSEVATIVDRIVGNSHWTGVSYTQLEAYFALALGKLLVIAVKDKCPDANATEQRAHLKRLQDAEGFRHLPDFVDSQDLENKIWRANAQKRFFLQPVRAPHISNLPRIYGDVDGDAKQYQIVGREDEEQMLNDAWESNTTKIIGFIANGGMGKSSLVKHWLSRFSPSDPVSIFAFSFYRQGQTEQQVDSDTFFRELAAFFEFTDGNEAPSAKGRIVAERVMRERSLLILDGIEPLQETTGFFRRETGQDCTAGQFTDNGIKTFLETLAMAKESFEGLCVLTSRVPVRDLHYLTSDKRYDEKQLHGLTADKGKDLLQNLGVKGLPDQLRSISNKLNGHPLALLLTGTMIRDRDHGKIAAGTTDDASETLGSMLPHDLSLRSEGAVHTFKAIQQYVTWLQTDGRNVELDLLNVIGLFDRAAERSAVNAMKASPPIRGLTQHLCGASNLRVSQALDRLVRAGLIARIDYDQDNEWDSIESHPLIREYFSYCLKNAMGATETTKPSKTTSSAAFRGGHRRLFQHYAARLEEYPETNQAMSQLYRTISHCCLAGKVSHAFTELLQKRAWRSDFADSCDHNYATRHLGMISADFVALTQFFEGELEDLNVHPAIKKKSRFTLLTDLAVRMRSLGRLRRAKEALQKAIQGITIAMIKEGYDGAFAAAQLSELELISGDLKAAEATARQAVRYSDEQPRTYHRFHARTSLADVLMQKGQLDEAGEFFREAKAIADADPNASPPFLYSQTCYRYGLYLCESGHLKEWIALAQSTEHWGDRRPHKRMAKTGSLLSSAIDQMILSEAYVRRDELDGEFREQTLETIEGRLGSINQLKGSGYVDYLARGLNIAARFHTGRKTFEAAAKHLELNGEYVRQGGMRLLEADYLIEKCRFHVAKKEWPAARESHEAATTLSKAIGYRRRQNELDALSERLP